MVVGDSKKWMEGDPLTEAKKMLLLPSWMPVKGKGVNIFTPKGVLTFQGLLSAFWILSFLPFNIHSIQSNWISCLPSIPKAPPLSLTMHSHHQQAPHMERKNII